MKKTQDESVMLQTDDVFTILQESEEDGEIFYVCGPYGHEGKIVLASFQFTKHHVKLGTCYAANGDFSLYKVPTLNRNVYNTHYGNWYVKINDGEKYNQGDEIRVYKKSGHSDTLLVYQVDDTGFYCKVATKYNLIGGQCKRCKNNRYYQKDFADHTLYCQGCLSV